MFAYADSIGGNQTIIVCVLQNDRKIDDGGKKDKQKRM